MTRTAAFFNWFLTTGLAGLGGWVFFLLIALAAVIWLLYDSQSRRLPAVGWRIGVLVITGMMLPTILFKFTGQESGLLGNFMELIFYLGMMAGLLPMVLAVGYFITYQGMRGCSQGHIFEQHHEQCPDCLRIANHSQPSIAVNISPQKSEDSLGLAQIDEDTPNETRTPETPVQEIKSKIQAWLVSQEDSRTYQLFHRETTIGRTSSNDILIKNEPTVSKQHAKIIEKSGHLRLIDLGSTNGTFVNNQRIVQPTTLEHDDEIRFGDNTIMYFMTTRS